MKTFSSEQSTDENQSRLRVRSTQVKKKDDNDDDDEEICFASSRGK